MASLAEDNYLRALYEIIEKKGSARPKDLVRALDVSAPSVTEMLHKLADKKLVHYQKRREISLTAKGRKKAIALKARYQVFLKLFKMAGVSSATAYADSCRIENQLSAETVSKLVEFMERLEKTMLCKKL